MDAAEQTILLTNRCDYDEAHLTAALGEQLRGQRRKQNIVLAIGAALLLAYCVVAWFKFRDTQYLIVGAIMLVLGAALAYLVFRMPARAARKQAARIAEVNGGKSFRILFRTDDIGFVNPKDEEISAVPYSRLMRIAEPNGLIVLITVEKRMLLADPRGFADGSEADFWRLMNEKCRDALPADRRA